MVQEGSNVIGVNMRGEEIQGEVTNVLKIFNVAIVKTGEDRTEVCSAYIDKLVENN